VILWLAEVGIAVVIVLSIILIHCHDSFQSFDIVRATGFPSLRLTHVISDLARQRMAWTMQNVDLQTHEMKSWLLS
jgi:hypothetical protein